MSPSCTEMSFLVTGCCNVGTTEIQPDSIEFWPRRFIISASFILFSETPSLEKKGCWIFVFYFILISSLVWWICCGLCHCQEIRACLFESERGTEIGSVGWGWVFVCVSGGGVCYGFEFMTGYPSISSRSSWDLIIHCSHCLHYNNPQLVVPWGFLDCVHV